MTEKKPPRTQVKIDKALYENLKLVAMAEKMTVVDLVDKLFTEIAPKYADRNGGYTRIIKIGQRKGDAAMEVLIELV